MLKQEARAAAIDRKPISGALAPACARLAAMTDHKYKVGSKVAYSRAGSANKGGEYKIVRLLPPEGDVLQYRIKSQTEPVERVVKEFQLMPWKG